MPRLPDSRPLAAGETFPHLDLTLVDGKSIAIPEWFMYGQNVVLVVRPRSCAATATWLAAWQEGYASLKSEGIGLYALTGDPLPAAAELAASHGLTFPLGCGVEVAKVARTLGVEVSDEGQLESAAFVVTYGARLLDARYAAGGPAPFTWQDAVAVVRAPR